MLKPNRECNESLVLARLKSKAGKQFQSNQLANYFGIPTARMTDMLITLTVAKQIRRVRCGGNPTVYYIPTEEQIAAESRIGHIAAPIVISVPVTME